jgi:opacity protein-like surface antigen
MTCTVELHFSDFIFWESVMQSKKLFLGSLAGALLALSSAASAQVHQSVVGADHHLWVGAEYSHFNPDYGPQDLDGIGVYANTIITGKFGAELDARFLVLNQFQGETEKDFLIGPTYRAYSHDKFTVNAKILLGIDKINYPGGVGYGTYFAYAPAGDVEYRLTSRLKLRAGYEFDFIPGAPGTEFTYPAPSNGLTPHGFNIGVSYRVF